MRLNEQVCILACMYVYIYVYISKHIYVHMVLPIFNTHSEYSPYTHLPKTSYTSNSCIFILTLT